MRLLPLRRFWTYISTHLVWSAVVALLVGTAIHSLWSDYGPRRWLKKTEPSKTTPREETAKPAPAPILPPIAKEETEPPQTPVSLPAPPFIWITADKLPSDPQKASDALRRQLRSKTGVRPLRAEEHGVKVTDTATGVFGFVEVFGIIEQRDSKGQLAARLYRSATANYIQFVEVQVPWRDRTYLVGFVSEQSATELQRGGAGTRFALYGGRWLKAPEIVAVDLAKVKVLDMRFISPDQEQGTGKERTMLPVFDMTVK